MDERRRFGSFVGVGRGSVGFCGDVGVEDGLGRSSSVTGGDERGRTRGCRRFGTTFGEGRTRVMSG